MTKNVTKSRDAGRKTRSIPQISLTSFLFTTIMSLPQPVPPSWKVNIPFFVVLFVELTVFAS